MIVGAHIHTAGGLTAALETARAIGCDCMQVFLRNPRSWAGRSRPAGEAAAFAARRAADGLAPLVVHMPYLINLASPDPGAYRRSVASMEVEMEAAAAVGADYYVIHPGSHRGTSLPGGRTRLIAALKSLARPGGPRILVENTAGQGDTLCASWTEFGPIFDALGDAVGACLDTAHAFAAGYDIRTAAGFDAMAGEIEKTFPVEYILLIHANDSASECGSRRDRHAHIGEGRIGAAGFRLVAGRPFGGLPFVIETPKESAEREIADIRMLRSLGATHHGTP